MDFYAVYVSTTGALHGKLWGLVSGVIRVDDEANRRSTVGWSIKTARQWFEATTCMSIIRAAG